MVLLSDAMNEKEFDVRMVARGLNKGLILREDVSKYEKKLVDEAAHGEYINLETNLEAIRGKSGLRA